jgi:hypothetical protein
MLTATGLHSNTSVGILRFVVPHRPGPGTFNVGADYWKYLNRLASCEQYYRCFKVCQETLLVQVLSGICGNSGTYGKDLETSTKMGHNSCGKPIMTPDSTNVAGDSQVDRVRVGWVFLRCEVVSSCFEPTHSYLNSPLSQYAYQVMSEVYASERFRKEIELLKEYGNEDGYVANSLSRIRLRDFPRRVYKRREKKLRFRKPAWLRIRPIWQADHKTNQTVTSWTATDEGFAECFRNHHHHKKRDRKVTTLINLINCLSNSGYSAKHPKCERTFFTRERLPRVVRK